MFQLRRHQLDRGGRWRRSRHLRRVQRPRQGGMEMICFPYRNRFKFPFLGDLFSEITNEFCPESLQKVTCKKCEQNDRHARRQNRADPEQLRDHVLDSQNTDTARRWLKNMSPKRSPACLGRCTLLKWRLRRN